MFLMMAPGCIKIKLCCLELESSTSTSTLHSNRHNAYLPMHAYAFNGFVIVVCNSTYLGEIESQ
jgi:hypothetical protein